MTKETAVYAVQRGASLYNCKGEDFCDKITSGDIFTVTRSNGTTYKYSYSEDADTAINDSDSIACTDTNGTTYKITGTQFKELFSCAPEFVIHHEYVSSECDTQPTPSLSVYSQNGGTLRVKHYVEFITASNGYTVELDRLQTTKNPRDDRSWSSAQDEGGGICSFYLYNVDPQESLDSNVEPPKITVRTKWRLKNRSGNTVDDGYEYFEFTSHEGPAGKPSFYKLGPDFRPNLQKIREGTKYESANKFGVTITQEEFDYNTQGCMRNVTALHRYWDANPKASKNDWKPWSIKTHYQYWTQPGDVRVYQVKQIVKTKYNPYSLKKETIPIDYEIHEFAIKFKDSNPPGDDSKLEFDVEYGGKYDAPYDGYPKFFVPKQLI